MADSIRAPRLSKRRKTGVVYDREIYSVVFSDRKLRKKPKPQNERGKVIEALFLEAERVG